MNLHFILATPVPGSIPPSACPAPAGAGRAIVASRILAPPFRPTLSPPSSSVSDRRFLARGRRSVAPLLPGGETLLTYRSTAPLRDFPARRPSSARSESRRRPSPASGRRSMRPAATTTRSRVRAPRPRRRFGLAKAPSCAVCSSAFAAPTSRRVLPRDRRRRRQRHARVLRRLGLLLALARPRRRARPARALRRPVVPARLARQAQASSRAS